MSKISTTQCAFAIAATALAACVVGVGGGAVHVSLAVRAAEPAPIAIIGVDGADWQTIDPLIAAGRLPAFAVLKAAGGTGTMRPEPPLLSPIIWTTIATGRRPEDHGVLDFMVDQPGGVQMPVSGGARRTKALWEIFSDAGRPVLISGWWATWPPDRVRGVIVSDRVAVPHMRLDTNSINDAALVHPPERLRDVAAARAAPETIGYAALNEFVPLTRKEFDEAVASDKSDGTGAGLYRNRFAHTRAALAAARTYGAATTRLLPAVRPAFAAVYFDLVDTVSHLFTADPQRRERAIGSAYSEIDQQIRAIARALEPGTFVIVMSDHGFYRADAGIPDDPSDLTSGAAAWHRPYGIVAATTAGALAGTSAAPKLAPLGAVSPLDIAPSVLARADLAVAGDMPGRVLNTLTGGARVTTIASYGAHRLPEQTAGDGRDNLAELERLRALGYVSGRSAVTTLARVNLGEILFRKGAFKEAIVQLEGAVAADRLNQRAGLWLARAYTSANRPDDAVRLYDRLLQAPAGGTAVDPLIVLAATDLDIARGQRAGAADRLARLPAALSRQPETTLARGAIAEADGKPLEAERLFRAAYTAQPTNIDALSRLVDLLIRNGRGAAAAQVAGEAARRFPDSPERLALVGEAALAERRIADAVRAFRQALVLAPDAASVRVELGRAELLQNDADAALEAIDEVAGHDADVVRGAAFSIKGNWPAAVLAYARAAGEGCAVHRFAQRPRQRAARGRTAGGGRHDARTVALAQTRPAGDSRAGGSGPRAGARREAATVKIAFATVAIAIAAGVAIFIWLRPVARPNVILITIDTLRADHLGVYGDHDAATPTLDALARRGVRFADVVSPAPLTLPSHTSILTGLTPARHGVRNNPEFAVSESVPTLAERFHAAGYATAAFVSGFPLSRRFGLARGFDVYDDRFPRGDAASPAPYTERRADGTVAAVRAWFDRERREQSRRPYLLWVHFFDPHRPYDPPEPFRDRFSNPYDGEIAFVDQAVADVLTAAGDPDATHTIVAVTADHGEALDEHGEPTHGLFIYSSTIRVPLILAGPAIPPGVVVEPFVRLIDITPTLLDLTRLAALPGIEGRSLAPLIAAGSQPADPEPAYFESLFGRLCCGWAPLYGWREGSWAYIDAPQPELYDVDRRSGAAHQCCGGAPRGSGAVPAVRPGDRGIVERNPVAPRYGVGKGAGVGGVFQRQRDGQGLASRSEGHGGACGANGGGHRARARAAGVRRGGAQSRDRRRPGNALARRHLAIALSALRDYPGAIREIEALQQLGDMSLETSSPPRRVPASCRTTRRRGAGARTGAGAGQGRRRRARRAGPRPGGCRPARRRRRDLRSCPLASTRRRRSAQRPGGPRARARRCRRRAASSGGAQGGRS